MVEFALGIARFARFVVSRGFVAFRGDVGGEEVAIADFARVATRDDGVDFSVAAGDFASSCGVDARARRVANPDGVVFEYHARGANASGFWDVVAIADFGVHARDDGVDFSVATGDFASLRCIDVGACIAANPLWIIDDGLTFGANASVLGDVRAVADFAGVDFLAVAVWEWIAARRPCRCDIARSTRNFIGVEDDLTFFIADERFGEEIIAVANFAIFDDAIAAVVFGVGDGERFAFVAMVSFVI